ncbi:MAG TPA: ATP-binding protein [Terriglobales bacterium]|nr:ATP-binding protein [Terriglobales bacterium]
MSLRWRLLLIFGGIVVVTVGLIAYVATVGARKAFHSFEDKQAYAIKGQLDKEFELQGQTLALEAEAIARSQQIRNMALALSAPGGDAAPYLNLAATLASEQRLDYLDILGPDGTIISSAEWPARFGVREEWVATVPNWQEQQPFLREQETAQGKGLALLVVREVTGTDRTFYVVAGRHIDSNFLRNLVLPAGTSLLLWQPAGSSPGELQDISGEIPLPDDLKPVLEQALNGNNEVSGRARLKGTSYSLRAIPLSGRDSRQPLAVLVIATSQNALSNLRRTIRNTALLIAFAGIVLSILVSGWWAGRISRPIEELSSAAEDVAAGNWERKVAAESLSDKDEVARLIASFNKMTGELLQQRDRALQAERVAAWRELARRLAHELKNPLFPLQITVENLMKARQQNSPEFNEIFAESTTTLLAELSNLRKIIGRFSDFSKMPTPHWQQVNVNELLGEITRLFAPQLTAGARPIKLEMKFAAGDTTIAGDPDLLRRAFENLVLNAIDAMPDRGELRIETSASAGAVVVEIADTGAGLSEEEAGRLFTPYYTTKQHGTGLGLAIVQSVISDHGARISVSSRPGKGTTFRMEFKRARSNVDTAPHGRVLGESAKM